MDARSTLSEQSQYLSFLIGGEEYAIGILRVREIIEYDTVTTVPTTPPCIRGVINLRGSVVPVVDLAVKLGLPESAVTKRTCIVIVEVELDGRADGDGPDGRRGQPGDRPAPRTTSSRRRRSGRGSASTTCSGMGRAGKKFVLLLDIDRVLSTDDAGCSHERRWRPQRPQRRGVAPEATAAWNRDERDRSAAGAAAVPHAPCPAPRAS